MLKKKICMIGTNAVGKTSLVRRFVHCAFSETYESNIGVKMEKKVVKVPADEVTLVLWDLYGEDKFQQIQMSYLRGMDGYLLVADSTRRKTYDDALALQEKVTREIGKFPFVFLLNKCDLANQRDIETGAEGALEQRGWQVRQSSAKTGQHVEESFLWLANEMTAK